jgi:hypothetical protein
LRFVYSATFFEKVKIGEVDLEDNKEKKLKIIGKDMEQLDIQKKVFFFVTERVMKKPKPSEQYSFRSRVLFDNLLLETFWPSCPWLTEMSTLFVNYSIQEDNKLLGFFPVLENYMKIKVDNFSMFKPKQKEGEGGNQNKKQKQKLVDGGEVAENK